MSKLIYLEGNIGAGKTTILNYIRDNYKSCVVLPEPIEQWMKMDNLFMKMYTNPKKWGFPFQIYALSTRLDRNKIEVEKAIKNGCKYIILERSGLVDKDCFMKLMLENGNIDNTLYKIYESLYNSFMMTHDMHKDAIILYLKTNIDNCIKRIQKRSRTSENVIDKNYLIQVEKKHNEIMDKHDHYIIDGDVDLNSKSYKKNIDKIFSIL